MEKSFNSEMIKIKPKSDLFKPMGVLLTTVEEVVLFPARKKVELKCTLSSTDAFKELDIIEEVLKKQFGRTMEFNFNVNFQNEKINLDDMKKIMDRVIFEIKKECVYSNAYLSIYRYNFSGNEVHIELKNDIAVEKLKKNFVDEKIRNKIKKLLNVEIKIELSVGNFEKELRNLEENNFSVASYVKKEEDKPFTPPIKQAVKESPKSSSGGYKREPLPKKETPGDLVYGKEIKQGGVDFTLFDDLLYGEQIVLEGEIFKFETKETSTGKIIVTFNITNKKDSVTAKIFINAADEMKTVKNGEWLRIKGKKQQDKFNNMEDVLFLTAIEKIEPKRKIRKDNAEVKRVELHAHTKMSDMDSVAEVSDLVKRAINWGHKAVSITDHGVVHAFPFAYHDVEHVEDFKLIMGIEGYLVDDEAKMVKQPKNIALEQETYVVFDIETTGFDPYGDSIIEIGAVKMEGTKIVDRFSTFIDPDRKIPPKITELTSITDAMVEGAPKINEALADFIEFVGDATVVAHNANFDVGFVTQKLHNMGKEFHNSVIDTLHWSRTILKENKRHNLKEVTKHFGISLENHHRAVDDAEATAEIFKKFMGMVLKENAYLLTEVDNVYKNNIESLPTYHIILLVKNKEGLRNLYELVSLANLKYYHRRPRIPKSLLKKMRGGMILGSACEAGEVIQAYLRGKSDEEIKEIAEFYDYIEMQPNSNNKFLIANGTLKSEEDLKDMNRYLYNLGKNLSKPVCATGDVHYLDPEEYIYRAILMYGCGFKDAETDSGLYFRTTQEMLDEFSYLGAAESYEVVVTNTNLVADMIENVKPIPDGFYPPIIEGANEQVREMSYETAKRIYGEPLPEVVEARVERELKAIIDNGFAVLYLTAQKLVKKSLDNGYIVGSRGSVGSSLVAYMMNITEVNALYPHYLCTECKYVEFKDYEGSGVDLPDKVCPECGHNLKKDGHTIPFEVFMGFKGDKVPDIDLNFSGEYQSSIHRYTEELFGKENVFKAGTISTLAEKNAFGYVKKFVEETGKKMRKAEMERLAKGCENVRKTTGQHPGGMIVVPSTHSIYEFCPVQRPANDSKADSITTHFDYHCMDTQLVKLDILGHDDPTTIKLLLEYTGIDLNDVPIGDPETISIFSSTKAIGVTEEQISSPVGTFGIPEFGTQFVRQMLIETRPKTFAELVRISGLSHGTDVWLNNAQEYIKQGVAKLSEVITVRDDIMNYLIDAGLEKGTAFQIMEFVRKGNPSKQPEKWEEYSNLMKEHKVKEWYIESCKKIKYMFPKGHAVAYVMMAMRIAYFKVHYPLAFYAAFLSRKADEFNAETMIKPVAELKVMRETLSKELKLDVKQKGEMILYEILIEMHYRNIELLGVDVYKSESKKFIIEENKLRAPLIAVSGLGDSVVENIVNERNEGKFISVEDFIRRTKVSRTVVEKLKVSNALNGLPESTQMQMF